MRMIAQCFVLLALVVAGSAPAAEPVTKTLRHRVEVTAEYPQVGNEDVDGMIRSWLEEHIGEITAAFSGIGVYPDLNEESADSIGIDYETNSPSERVASFVVRTVVFPFRAAHPSTRADTLNFDLEKGEWLAFADIFGDPDKALALMAEGARGKVEKCIRDEFPDQAAEGSLDLDEDWFNGGAAPTPENYAAFCLVPGGVRVIFQQYQILPYVFGLVEATYSLEELAAARPNPALWGK